MLRLAVDTRGFRLRPLAFGTSAVRLGPHGNRTAQSRPWDRSFYDTVRPSFSDVGALAIHAGSRTARFGRFEFGVKVGTLRESTRKCRRQGLPCVAVGSVPPSSLRSV